MKFLSTLIIYLFISLRAFSQSAQPDKPVVDVNAFAKLRTGELSQVMNISVEEFLTIKIYALLNYIFFDEGSADIPKRYVLFKSTEETDIFHPKKQFLESEILDVYWNFLNIVGYRMRINPNENIHLKGYNSDNGVEDKNTDLSHRRAVNIKNYLIKIWKIDSNRINIDKPGNLPLKFSRSETHPKLADEENRRVEIDADWDILQPLVVTDTLREVTPPTLHFRTMCTAKKPVSQWKLNIKQYNKELKSFIGRGEPASEFTWKIAKKEMPGTEDPLRYNLEALSDLRGSSGIKRMNVEQKRLVTKRALKLADKEYRRYNLILFDFNSFEFADYNRKILSLISENIEDKESTNFYISGFTDITGNPDFNMKLSNQRAESTKNFLLKIGYSPKQIMTYGFGNSANPFYKSALTKVISEAGDYDLNDYFQSIFSQSSDTNLVFGDLPEGRFYCRTVVVEVESKVK